MAARERADRLLVRRGLAPSREKAQALILAGRVFSEGRRVDKPGAAMSAEAPLEVAGETRPYAGRGGEKLAGALDRLPLSVQGRVALDVGASVGGFTDVLLRRGVAAVVAVDVGYGQLDWGLRNDPRVRVLERVNARYLRREQLPCDLPGAPDLATVDVSFISLEKVLPAVLTCLAAPGDVVALAKPQFEAGRDRVGRGGVVRDPAVHEDVLRRLIEWSGGEGLAVRGVVPSPLPGAEGNREFFLWLRPGEEGPAREELEARLREVVWSGSG